MSIQSLFLTLFHAQTESDVDEILKAYSPYFVSENWFPIGGTESNFSVIENQQSNPIDVKMILNRL